MKVIKIAKIIFIVIVLSIFVVSCSFCSANNSDTLNDENITYLLNIRTKKVHSKDCGVGKRSKDKNKQYRTDSLTNIINDGYTICGDCNAGIKKRLFADLLYKFDDGINTDYDDIVLPTKEEYLKAVSEIGKWYVDNVATYCRNLQEENASQYVGDGEFIDNVKLKTKNKLFNNTNNYKYLTKNETNIDIDDLKDDDKILRSNEKAVFNYKNKYNNINVKGGILQYPCKYIEDSPYYNKAGDDCIRYLFTVLNSIDSQFVERIAKTYQTKWSKINTSVFNDDEDNIFLKTMTVNGFKIYTSNKEINDNRINIIDKNFKLEKGDIICRKGHIHIYIGNAERDNFGWGKVNRYFPAYYNFSIVNINNEYVIKMDKGVDTEYYTKVYRYIGEIGG